MPARFAATAVALAAVLLALPACRKKDDGPAGPGMNLPSDPNLRMKSQNNLKQIVLAVVNFASANWYVPAGIVGPDGKSVGLSWRVQFLPYIEEDFLFRQFKLDEAWDGPNNRALVARM